MDFLYSDGPIIACSTNSLSPTAINVLRLSGFSDLGSIGPLISLLPSKIKPRYAHYCKILDGKDIIDDVVLTYFEAPHSYNGENVLEISVHGNPFNTQRIIDLFVQKGGFQHAKPGEFSYRALKNKKMSLAQIEGLDLLLNANGKFVLEQGRSFMSGNLYSLYQELYQALLEHKASLEILTDFSDDVGEESAFKNLQSSFSNFFKIVDKLESRICLDSSQILNAEIALIGQPNSGKSTLFNSLLEENRAIVTEIAGTTRDTISEKIKIGPHLYRLTDTAGIRVSNDKIEAEGIKRSIEVAKRAFFRILVVNPANWDDEFYSQITSLTYDYLVITHNDLVDFKGLLAPIEPKLPKIGRVELGIEKTKTKKVDSIKSDDFNYKSTQFQELEKHISAKMLKLQENNPILLDRHNRIIKELAEQAGIYSKILASEDDIGILSSEIQILDKITRELIGIVSPNDVLQHIFTNFCIGK